MIQAEDIIADDRPLAAIAEERAARALARKTAADRAALELAAATVEWPDGFALDAKLLDAATRSPKSPPFVTFLLGTDSSRVCTVDRHQLRAAITSARRRGSFAITITRGSFDHRDGNGLASIQRKTWSIVIRWASGAIRLCHRLDVKPARCQAITLGQSRKAAA